MWDLNDLKDDIEQMHDMNEQVVVPPPPPLILRVRARLYTKRDLNQNLSGDEVYYKKSLTLLVKNMLCSKLYCQRGFDLILLAQG